MEERASIAPGLPRESPTVSYWQDPPSSLANHRTTSDLPVETDVCVIGSGITGATVAYHLLSKSSARKVLVLEARTACSGATGRNGGHTKHAHYRQFLENLQSFGEDEAARIARFEFNCMRAVHAFAKDHGIGCDSWQGDTVDVIYDDGQLKKASKAVAEMKRVLGENDPVARYKFWDPQQTYDVFRAEGALGAVSYEAGSLSAYKFVIGILNLALDKGLNLQTETPVLKLFKNENDWIVQTARGDIQAGSVILATNGYTAHLYPALQGVIVPLRGHMTAQRPGSSLPKNGLDATYSFIYANGYEYMIPRPQGSKFAGDICIGGGVTKASHGGEMCEFGEVDDTRIDPAILQYLIACTKRYFGPNWGQDHPEGRLRMAWTGIMGYSGDGFPLVGRIPGEKKLFIAASFQGSGMILCFDSAKALVKLMSRDEAEGTFDEQFPNTFRITPERMERKFKGRPRLKISAADLEVKSQS